MTERSGREDADVAEPSIGGHWFAGAEHSEGPNFEGHPSRECGEHRTVGSHRAWCFDCTEWCYPRVDMACKGCELPALRAQVAALTVERNEIEAQCIKLARWNSELRADCARVDEANEAMGAALAEARREREAP